MKRQRGRNNNNMGRNKPHLPVRAQTFDSSGPDVRIRGNAYQVLEKYLALARDATAAGDRIAAENFYQHAEHYYRLINAEGQQRQQHHMQGGQGGGQQHPDHQQRMGHQQSMDGTGPQPGPQPYDPGAQPQPAIGGPQPLVQPQAVIDGQPSD